MNWRPPFRNIPPEPRQMGLPFGRPPLPYSVRCWLIRWLAGRDSFLINVNVRGRIEIPPTSRGVYVGRGSVVGMTRRASSVSRMSVP